MVAVFTGKKAEGGIRSPMILWISLALFMIIALIAWLFFRRLQTTIAMP